MALRRRRLLLALLTVATLAISALVFRAGVQRWYVLRTHFERLPNNAAGLREFRHRQTGVVFVELDEGQFEMGTASRHANHRVAVSSFLIAKYEVTQKQWASVMGEPTRDDSLSEHPVVGISWFDCRVFCSKTGLSLPTEAQWEYACRAGTTTKFSVGEELRSTDANCNFAHPSTDESTSGWATFAMSMLGMDGGGEELKVGGAYAPNPWGIYDLHGNAWEWCIDDYGVDFFASEESRKRDPVCQKSSNEKVRRGGSYTAPPASAACAARNWHGAGAMRDDIGLRPVFNFD